ncbi:MAG TPA: type II toxin-antitoxin system prevent-host-death family antitoxin [Caulobacteraceae bacterium]|jgi:prevent-host-death family protein
MQIGAFEAKNTLGALLDRVEQGEEIVITRHGKPVARLAPCVAAIDKDAARAALDRIRRRAGGLAPTTWDTLKADRDMGRP